MTPTTIRYFLHAGWMRCSRPDPHSAGPCPACAPWPGASRHLHTPQPQAVPADTWGPSIVLTEGASRA